MLVCYRKVFQSNEIIFQFIVQYDLCKMENKLLEATIGR